MINWLLIIPLLVSGSGAQAHLHPHPGVTMCRPTGPFIGDPWLPPAWTHCAAGHRKGHHS